MAAYREPEEWEKNIIALEKGEWGEALSVDAFKRWNKQRPRLPSFRIRPDHQQQSSTTASSVPPAAGAAPEVPVEQMLKDMNLPNTAGSVRLVKNIARASQIFKSYAQFAEEADLPQAEKSGHHTAKPDPTGSSMPVNPHTVVEEKKPKHRRSRSKGKKPKSLPRNAIQSLATPPGL